MKHHSALGHWHLSRSAATLFFSTLPMGDSAPKMLCVPPDERYIVPNGRLLFHPDRDGRHPYLYEVETHPLDQRTDPALKGRTIVFIQDTSPEGLQKIQAFEDTLCVLLCSVRTRQYHS